MPQAGRIGDPSHCPADAHGCPACPHDVTGPATSGSPDVLINGLLALREGDRGSHGACCGENGWEAVAGAPGVFINGRAAHRVGDAVEHCGGGGELAAGSPNVIIGDYVTSGGPAKLPYAGGFELYDHDGALLPYVEYVIRQKDGTEHRGRSDHRGRTCVVFTDEPEELEVEILAEDCGT